MTAAAEIQDGVRFVPSKVEGAAGDVVEAVVYPDRLELVGSHGQVTLAYNSFAPRPSPPTVFRRLVGGGPTRPHVAVLSFARGHYPDSFVRFLAPQPVTLYMPAEGPTQFPDSVFARVLRTLHAGGYGVRDVGDPPSKPDAYDRLPRGVRTVVDGVMFFCVVNFVAFAAVAIYCHGNALVTGRVEDGRHYIGRDRRGAHEVSPGVWTFSWWHGVVTLATLPVLLVTGIATEAYGRPKP
jgi:hypothetical protein